MLIAVAAAVAAGLVAGCQCARRADQVEGVLDSLKPLSAPLSGAPACALRLEASYYSNAARRDRNERTPPRFAPGATLTVGGRTLPLTGKGGDPSGFVAGDRWQWREGQPAPDELRGFGKSLDTLFRCTEPEVHCSIHSLWVTEQRIPCGATVRLRGTVETDRVVVGER